MEQGMILCNHRVRAMAAAATFFILACDSGSPSRTPDELAADSALAADLALAYREPDAAEHDSSRESVVLRDSAAPPVASLPSGTPVTKASPVTKNVQPSPVTTPAPKPTPTAAPAKPAATTAAPPKPVAGAPKLKGLRACNSPTAENQSECMRVSIASADARLNRIYRALITEMRRQEKVPPGAKDPPSVQRLRVAQRAWVVYRDTECRKRGKKKE